MMTEEEWMLTTILDCKLVDLIVNPPQLDESQQAILNQMRERRLTGEPLQYICGTTSFADLTLAVDTRVLIPRPETEQVVDYAFNILSKKSQQTNIDILDCGTGSGNIPIYFAKNLTNAVVTSCDISADALDCARGNARKNNVERKIDFIHGDMIMVLQRLKTDNRQFDMIISNPPYIKTDDLKTLPKDVQYEPSLALDGGVDGCDFYRGIFLHAFDCLKNDGMLIVEMGDFQAADLLLLLKEKSKEWEISVQKDLCGRDRFMVMKKYALRGSDKNES